MGSENYVLPLSHDEVVHGKGSLLAKMPGDDWQKFANLRLLYAMQWFQPGKKLLFMGDELATWNEWSHEGTLDWSLHDAPMHEGVRLLRRRSQLAVPERAGDASRRLRGRRHAMGRGPRCRARPVRLAASRPFG